MSNTRRASGGGPLRQERFASSQEFERGLMANLVAKRCTLLDRPVDRELIWFLQLLSHAPGGLPRVAADLLARYPDKIGTKAMQEFGFKPGQIYSTDRVKTIRDELPFGGTTDFPLKGDVDLVSAASLLDEPEYDLDDYIGERRRRREKRRAQIDDEASRHPTNYPAAKFLSYCVGHAELELEKYLAQMCLDPGVKIRDGELWYFAALITTLRQYQAERIEARNCAAVTSIGSQVCDALDYATESRRLVLIDGNARIGKTYSAKAWSDQHPGRVRYVQVPSTNCDFSFFRAIAESLGVSINLKSKAQELRLRIEETLQPGHLTLVLDEAHYLWPQSNYRNTTPGRINWLMTALINKGVPVALITTPQFFRSQTEIERQTCWTSEQFTGRIGHYEKLPDTLLRTDLEAVARALLPGGDVRSIKAVTLYAEASKKLLAGIETVADRAKFLASRAQRQAVIFDDIKRALEESAIPSDRTFTDAIQAGEKNGRKRAVNVSARPSQPGFRSPETPTRQTPVPPRSATPALSADRRGDIEEVHASA